jgi:hypothetical protein
MSGELPALAGSEKGDTRVRVREEAGFFIYAGILSGGN